MNGYEWIERYVVYMDLPDSWERLRSKLNEWEAFVVLQVADDGLVDGGLMEMVCGRGLQLFPLRAEMSTAREVREGCVLLAGLDFSNGFPMSKCELLSLAAGCCQRQKACSVLYGDIEAERITFWQTGCSGVVRETGSALLADFPFGYFSRVVEQACSDVVARLELRGAGLSFSRPDNCAAAMLRGVLAKKLGWQ